MRKKAAFGMGCFWGVEDYFSKLPGVVSTRVGYAGGSTVDPTYHNIGDHTETVEITYDPAAVSYAGLLRHFWERHSAVTPHKRQYRSVIFTYDEEQERLARGSVAERRKSCERPIVTDIEPMKHFCPAEEYHQKYLQKLRGAAAAKRGIVC